MPRPYWSVVEEEVMVMMVAVAAAARGVLRIRSQVFVLVV